MEESVITRFIFLGTGIFVALLTISGVMLYYRTTQITIQETLEANDIDINRNVEIENLLEKDIVAGYELKNIIKYYYNSYEVQISINRYYVYNNKVNNGKKLINSGYGKIVNNEFFDDYDLLVNNILPNQKFSLDKQDGIYKFQLKV